jgi:DNA (cytosine-5)-methyltransferase 1
MPSFVSVCSGVEAASLALEPIGFRAEAFSEVEPFCCSLLEQRFPSVPNLGDLTKWRECDLPAADMLVGGTPCTSFSVAGARRSMNDASGQLALSFVEMFHAGGFACALWENVPGVLNTEDNAFGCFLGGLVGAGGPLREPPGGAWPGAGMASGPRARAAWIVRDAQYFGLAQRRRRVFVVASARDWFDPVKVLFERKSVPGHPQTRGEARAEVAGALGTGTSDGGGFGTDFECDGGLVPRVAPTLQAGGNSTGGRRPPGTTVDTCETLIPVVQCYGGNNASGPIDVAYGGAIRGRDDGAQIELIQEMSPALRASSGGSSRAIAFDARKYGVQRLLPVECEKLMGMPVGWTDIIHRGKPASDGDRYRAIGNSFAVPVVRWIGERIKRQFDARATRDRAA